MVGEWVVVQGLGACWEVSGWWALRLILPSCAAACTCVVH